MRVNCLVHGIPHNLTLIIDDKKKQHNRDVMESGSRGISSPWQNIVFLVFVLWFFMLFVDVIRFIDYKEHQ